ncbi:MAG: ABC transporter ATP-binding protein [Anaerolineales bacterium]|nr:ABC transporter ATP-binding protein [Anaerolineales bacterium]
MSAIEFQNVSKTFGGRKAVDAVNFKIESGEIFGLIGPNGAGKTTTMRMLVTLLQPDQGQILVGGHSVRQAPSEVRRQIGFMPDAFGVYDDMTVNEYLEFFAACYHVPKPQRPGLIKDLLELVDLPQRRNDMVDTLSTGLKQRLGLARVLIHDPSILVLDEPASGLDPRARIEIRELLLEVARLGKTILFSSHILADVAELCTRIGIMENGRVAAVGTLSQLSQKLTPHRLLKIALLDKAEETQAFLAMQANVSAVRLRSERDAHQHLCLELDFNGADADIQALLARLIENKFPIVHFSEENQKLEEVFMRTTKGIAA